MNGYMIGLAIFVLIIILVIVIFFILRNVDKVKLKEYKKEIIQNMKSLRRASTIETEEYLEKKLCSINKYILLVSISVAGACFFVLLFGVFSQKGQDSPFIFFTIPFALIFFPWITQKLMLKSNIKKNTYENLYIAQCYAYDKRSYTVSDDSGKTTYYEIKITDGDYYIDRWFDISEEQFNKTTINVTLYISYEANILDIVTDDGVINEYKGKDVHY